MKSKKNSNFENCYIMQSDDIKKFADTLADGFSRYNLFEYVCNSVYDHRKMSLFWALSIALNADNAICIADSKEINSVIVYIRPGSKEPSPIAYMRLGGLNLFRIGLKSLVRLLSFDTKAQAIAKKYKTAGDGYLMAFATRLDKQRMNYGKPLMQALLDYLDAKGEGCYLETLKPENVGLYERFGFELKESVEIASGNLTIFAMRRNAKGAK